MKSWLEYLKILAVISIIAGVTVGTIALGKYTASRNNDDPGIRILRMKVEKVEDAKLVYEIAFQERLESVLYDIKGVARRGGRELAYTIEPHAPDESLRMTESLRGRGFEVSVLENKEVYRNGAENFRGWILLIKW